MRASLPASTDVSFSLGLVLRQEEQGAVVFRHSIQGRGRALIFRESDHRDVQQLGRWHRQVGQDVVECHRSLIVDRGLRRQCEAVVHFYRGLLRRGNDEHYVTLVDYFHSFFVLFDGQFNSSIFSKKYQDILNTWTNYYTGEKFNRLIDHQLTDKSINH